MHIRTFTTKSAVHSTVNQEGLQNCNYDVVTYRINDPDKKQVAYPVQGHCARHRHYPHFYMQTSEDVRELTRRNLSAEVNTEKAAA